MNLVEMWVRHGIPSPVACMTGCRGRTSLPAYRLCHSGKRDEGGLCGTKTQCVIVAAIARFLLLCFEAHFAVFVMFCPTAHLANFATVLLSCHLV